MNWHGHRDGVFRRLIAWAMDMGMGMDMGIWAFVGISRGGEIYFPVNF